MTESKRSVFEACPLPERRRLAFYNAHRVIASGGEVIPRMLGRLGAEFEYWENQVQRAEADVHVARALLADAMQKEIAEDFFNIDKLAELPAREKVYSVQRASAVVGISTLIQRLFPAPRPQSKEAQALPDLELEEFSDIWFGDSIAGGLLSVYGRMPVDETGRPSEYELHVAHGIVDDRFNPALPSELPEAWFTYRNLYVKVAHGESNPELEAKLAQQGKQIDFSQMYKLTPHTTLAEAPPAPPPDLSLLPI